MVIFITNWWSCMNCKHSCGPICSLVPFREKSTAVASKPTAAVSSKGEYIITKLDDLVNWARRVGILLVWLTFLLSLSKHDSL